MSKYFAFLVLLVVAATTQGLPRNSDTNPRISPERIVGGVTADRLKYPFVVSLEWLGYYPFCGATFLGVVNGKSYFATACHCVENDVAEELSVVAKNTTSDSPQGQRLQISYIFINPLWDSYTLEGDVCLLESCDVPENSEQLSHIPICGYEDIETGKMAEVLGWGALGETGSQSSTLQVVEVPLVDTAACNAAYNVQGWDVFSSTMICAGYDEGSKDSCQGDSGGPIATKKADGSGKCLIGAVSWGLGCARPNYPGVYSYAVPMKNWIKDTISTGSPATTTTSTTSTTTTSTTTTTTEIPTTTTTTEASTTTTATTEVPTSTTTTEETTTTTTEIPTTTTTTTKEPETEKPTTEVPTSTRPTHQTNEPFHTTPVPEHKEKSLWDTHKTAVVICLCLVGALALAVPCAIYVALTKKLKGMHAMALTLPLAVTILLALTLGLTLVINPRD